MTKTAPSTKGQSMRTSATEVQQDDERTSPSDLTINRKMIEAT